MTRIIHFFYIDIEQLTFSQVQVHDTSSGYKQFVCEVGTSIFLHKKGIEQTQIKHFFSDLELLQMNFESNQDTSSGHKQPESEVATSKVSPYERYRPVTNYALFHPSNLIAQMSLGQNPQNTLKS